METNTIITFIAFAVALVFLAYRVSDQDDELTSIKKLIASVLKPYISEGDTKKSKREFDKANYPLFKKLRDENINRGEQIKSLNYQLGHLSRAYQLKKNDVYNLEQAVKDLERRNQNQYNKITSYEQELTDLNNIREAQALKIKTLNKSCMELSGNTFKECGQIDYEALQNLKERPNNNSIYTSLDFGPVNSEGVREAYAKIKNENPNNFKRYIEGSWNYDSEPKENENNISAPHDQTKCPDCQRGEKFYENYNDGQGDVEVDCFTCGGTGLINEPDTSGEPEPSKKKRKAKRPRPTDAKDETIRDYDPDLTE